MLSFHIKFMKTDRQMDGWTDGWTVIRTTVKQYAPDLSIWGHKKSLEITIRTTSIRTTN